MMCVFAVDSISMVVEPLPFKAVQLLMLVKFLAAPTHKKAGVCAIMSV